MSSSRCPGKTLQEIAGKPTIQYLLERLEHCQGLSKVVLATSVDVSDDPIEDFCRSYGVDCYRGPLDDVAGRFKEALDHYPFPVFARICGDRPFYDQDLVDKAVRLFEEGDYDLVTNALPKTFPSGQMTEVVSSATFQEAYAKMKEPEELEHVTKYFYRHADAFRILNFTAPENWRDANLVLNTKSDMQWVTELIEGMSRPHWTYHLEELVELCRAKSAAKETP